MAGFEPFTVCVVPFPYVERPVVKHRPCIVIGGPVPSIGLSWVLMITSADNKPWPGDVPIEDLARAGLPYPSVIRTAKIATAETTALTAIGVLAAAQQDSIASGVREILPEIL